MSKKYEREIEEILRNMDQGEPDGHVSPFRRPRARSSRGGLQFSLTTLSVILLVISVLLMVVAAGLAYYEQTTSLLTGVIAVAAFIMFLLAAVSGWSDSFRGSPLIPSPSRYDSTSFGGGPNTLRDAYMPPPSFGRTVESAEDEHAPTPLRRGPLDTFRTRLRLFRLRQRYRHSHEE